MELARVPRRHANARGVHADGVGHGFPYRPTPPRGVIGWYDDLLLIVGEEISTYDGHILAVGVPPHRYQLAPGTRAALTDIEDVCLTGWRRQEGGSRTPGR